MRTSFPDYDHINPDYFRTLDRKIDYLNRQGFVPLIEVMRRDATAAWGKYYGWPDSYARYIQYIWSRYQANICVYSPIHYDWVGMAMTEEEINAAANLVIERFGPPPFGTLATCNSSLSSQVNFGQFENNRWLTLQQIGNWREHVYYWYLTEIFHSKPARPALNGEPYYSGYQDRRDYTYAFGAQGGTAWMICTCVRPSTAASFPEASPATSTGPRASGAPMSKKARTRPCGKPSSGTRQT